MTVSKKLSNEEKNVFDNNVEIITIDGKTARTIQWDKDKNKIEEKTYKPGNYEPTNSGDGEQDDDRVKITITPPTGVGEYIIRYTIIGLLALIVVFAGITFIKKKVFTK